jgi:5'-3' exonuclease
MGLSGFYQLLKKQGCYTPSEVCLEDLRGKTVAIDGDFVMYVALHGHTKGATVTAEEIAKPISKWLDLAKRAGIHAIFVTTGGPPPVEKQAHCSVLRKRKRDRQQERIDELEQSLASLVDDIGEEVCVRDKICRMQNSIRCISGTLSQSVVDILLADGRNCVQAKSEADFMLVLLSEEHKCDYVATDDADIIVAGAEQVLRGFIRMLTDPQAVGKVFCRSDIMTCLQLTSDALLQLGALLSCDYQPPITNVGPVTAFRMIQKYGSVDKFLQSDVFNAQTKSKKRKYTLPVGMSCDTYIATSSRSVDIFRSRPDREISPVSAADPGVVGSPVEIGVCPS